MKKVWSTDEKSEGQKGNVAGEKRKKSTQRNQLRETVKQAPLSVARGKKGTLSLRTELILWSVGILLVFMGAQLVFTGYTAQNFAMWQKEQQMKGLMERLQANYSDDTMDIYDQVGMSQEIENLRIMIFSDHHLVYHSSSVENAPPRNNMESQPRPSTQPSDTVTDRPTEQTTGEVSQQPTEQTTGEVSQQPMERPTDPLQESVVQDVTAQQGASHQSYNIPPDVQQEVKGNVVTLERTFDFNGESRTVMIWSSVDAIDSAVALFIRVNTTVSFVIICITVLGVVVLSRRFIAPITSVEQVAASVSEMDFSNKADEHVRTRELSHLAQSINVMSDNLEETIGELSSSNVHLTNKVENQEKLEQMRRQFVANISHEMKTPLSMLMMYSESLKADMPGVDKTFYYDTIIQEAAGLNLMVEQLLDTSAVENGLSSVTLVSLDFSQFLEEFLQRMNPLLAAYQVETFVEEGVLIAGDVKYLEQSVRNYITNAIAHTETGGKIKISLVQEGGCAVYAVENQGRPIAKEDVPHLWESFYRADKSRTQTGSEKRVGLGLYIVKTCINSHYGEVFAENKGLGVVFSFSIPLIPPESS